MNTTNKISETVDAIGKMHFDGNIIPHTWYQNPLLRYDNGKVNLVAIIILSDIIYWYRPTVLRDEETGLVVSVKQKFSADKLQKKYQAWADGFGLTKCQVSDAVGFLVERGLITRELRTVGSLGNVVFIEPVVEKVQTLSVYKPIGVGLETDRVSGYKPIAIGLETDTYTENTPETTLTKNTIKSIDKKTGQSELPFDVESLNTAVKETGAKGKPRKQAPKTLGQLTPFEVPSLQQVIDYALTMPIVNEIGLSDSDVKDAATQYFNRNVEMGWRRNNQPVRNWHGGIATWFGNIKKWNKPDTAGKPAKVADTLFNKQWQEIPDEYEGDSILDL